MIWAGDNKTDMSATWNVICVGAEAIVNSNLALELKQSYVKEVIAANQPKRQVHNKPASPTDRT